MAQEIINIGILSHVDAGKTTITENILFETGAIRSKGSVDQGSATTDSLTVERDRGISVKAASVSFEWKNKQINLIDTPGHADFTAEVERCLNILDGAVLVISAVEGVQSQTYLLFEALKQKGIPVLIVINKLDRSGADYEMVLNELKSELGIKTFPLFGAINDGFSKCELINIWEENNNQEAYRHLGVENIADYSEEVFERFLNDETIDFLSIEDTLTELCQKQHILPVFTAIAKNDMGTTELLNGIVKYIKPYQSVSNRAEFSAYVFKVEQNKSLGRIAHIKVLSGTIKGRDIIKNSIKNTEEKVAQLRKRFANKLEPVDELPEGEVGIISGLATVHAGDYLGYIQNKPESVCVQQPVLTVQVLATDEINYLKLAEALTLLNAEDPLLSFEWFKTEKEFHLKLMGQIQIEILQAIILERFEIETKFTDPTVIYKETPSDEAVGIARYTMPKPCWAVLNFQIKPGDPGSGIKYNSQVSVDKIAKKYQNEIEETVPKVLKQGIKGWEVIDLEISLIDGEDHEMHSRPGDFILATPMALMDALKNASTTLLEPLFNFEIKAPEELLGQIASDLTTMRAVFANPEFTDGKFILKGNVPVSTALSYSIKLNSLTSGKGKIRLNFGGYQPCSDEQGVIRDYKGVNPLDTSQWILHKRGAFKADERKF